MMQIRVLHLLSKLDPGGIEKWLIELNRVKSPEFEHSILCISGSKGQWAHYFPNSQVFTEPNLRKGYFGFLFDMRAWLRRSNYDIVHIHLYRFSSLVALFAIGTGKIVVIHSHNDKRKEFRKQSLLSRVRERSSALFAEKIFRYVANARVAASKDAADALFGRSTDVHVIHCGVSLGRPDFPTTVPITQPDMIRLTAIGSLTRQKNHEFLIDLVDRLNKLRARKYALTILGEGSLRQDLEEKIRAKNLQGMIKMPGVNDQALDFLRESTDIFLFPSLFEGLGLAYIEAQAAGLKCIVSSSVPEEADVYLPHITRLPLDEEQWISAIEAWTPLNSEARLNAFSALSASDFSIEQSAKNIEILYHELST